MPGARLFQWLVPTLRVEVTVPLSLLAVYLIWFYEVLQRLPSLFSETIPEQGPKAFVGLILAVVVCAVGMVVPYVALIAGPRLYRRMGSAVVLTATVLLAGVDCTCGWICLQEARSGPQLFGVGLSTLLGSAALAHFGLVVLGACAVIERADRVEALLGPSRIDVGLLATNLVVIGSVLSIARGARGMFPAATALMAVYAMFLVEKAWPRLPLAAPADGGRRPTGQDGPGDP